ncbi:MAG: DUF58 domain-containing protein [Pleurocapsa minor GSE-CHR-MK-17-07R]|jgi:uncharacterized protein (DUF58 family)|nr:DUF58 domain-containing protein [Pleurocapsa minor GSE-CHR-MK 17-07R]
MAGNTPLFDESTRRKLEQLMLSAARVRAGAIKGDRRSNKRGSSIEFADYRNYTQGDDLRRLDWNVYARLDRPLIKVFEDEEDLATYLVIDASASMGASLNDDGDASPDAIEKADKFTWARRLAAGLSYISLISNDRLTVTALGHETQTFGPVRGRGHSARLLNFFGTMTTRGAIDLNASLRDFALRIKRPGLVIVISDLFSSSGFIDGVNMLMSKGCEVAVLHVLTPEELEPSLGGDLRLVDVETGIAQEVSVDGGLRDLYVKRVTQWRDDLRAECSRRGVHYAPLSTDMPFERVILQDLRRMGILR